MSTWNDMRAQTLQENLEQSSALVSIILPAFNAADTLSDCIESLLGQTYQNIELLVADDNSTDGTATIVRAFDDPRIRLFQNSNNLGAGRCRDLLIQQATGQWVAFVDADDLISQERIKRLVAFASNFGECIVFDDFISFRNTPPSRPSSMGFHGAAAFSETSGGAARRVSASQLLRHKSLLVKVLICRSAIVRTGTRHEPYVYGEDALFLLQLMLRGVPAFYFPEPHYYYRISKTSASTNPDRYSIMAQALNDLWKENLDLETAMALRAKLNLLEIKHEITRTLRSPTALMLKRGVTLMLKNPQRIPLFLAMILRWAKKRIKDPNTDA